MSRIGTQRGIWAGWARLTTARPWLTLAVTAVVTAAALSIALQLKPGTGVQDMLADNQPSAIALGKMLDHFSLVDDLILLAQIPDQNPGDPASTEDNVQRLIGFAERLHAVLDDEPTVQSMHYRPSAEASAFIENVLVPHGWSYLDEGQRAALLERLTPTAMKAQFQQNRAMLAAPGPAAGRLSRELIRDPLRLREFLSERAASGSSGLDTRPGVDALVSRDGRAILIRIAGIRSASDLTFTADFMPMIRGAVDRAEPDGLRIDYTGAYAIAELSAKQTRADMIRSVLGSVVLLVLLFLLVYRHPLAFPVLMLPVNVAIVAAFGLYAVASGRLTPVTAVAGAVLAGLGIDYCVHYVSHHQAERLETGGDERAAAIRASSAVGPAMLAACVTSLIGFGAALSSHVRSLREFSILAVLGLLASLFAALTVLPATILVLRRTGLAQRGLTATRLDLSAIIRVVSRRPGRWAVATLIVTVAAAVVLAFSATRGGGLHSPLQFDRDLHAMHPQPHPPLDAQELVAERFGASPNALTLFLEAEDTDALLALSHEVQSRLADVSLDELGVSGIVGPASLLPDPRLNAQPPDIDLDAVLQDFNDAAEQAGFRPEAFAAYESFLGKLLTDTTRPGVADVWAYPDLAGMVLPKQTPSPRQGLVLATLSKPWTSADERDQAIEAVRSALADLPGATLTGISVVGYDTQQAIGGHLGQLLGIAAGAVLLWLLIFFRRPGDVALALAPAIVGLIVLMAAMCLLNLTLNTVNLIALPLIVGIGVDDGIFLAAIHRRCRKIDMTPELFVGQLAASTHAVTMTSLTTGLAFGSLAFTSVPAIKSLGVLTAVGVGSAWLVSLLGLVPTLILLHRRSAGRSTQTGDPAA